MLSRWIKPCFYAGLVFLIIGSFFISTNLLAFNGPHKLSQNECDVCHIPHHAADDMLWARATTGPFTGVKRLCYSCHGKGYLGAKDIYNIFNEYGEDVTYDHVMGPDASTDGPSIIREDWTPFPLKEKEGGEGFYCGSCHDPHIDPYEPVGDQGGGDYLRQETEGLIKNAKDKENSFCNQCHKGIISGNAYGHGSKKGCYDCHHPHNSKNQGPKILISPLVSFTAIPNCRGFSDSGETASACYGCHMEGSGFDGALGAPFAGDDLDTPREHHPMGIGADASTSGHQPTQAGPLSPSGELYCASCHTVHDGTNDHYLNPRVVLDFDRKNSGLFCIACHSSKTIEDLGPRREGHHQVSPNNQCLFCHSIHDSPNDPDALYQTDEDEANQFNSSVSVDVIMRIAPENLAWSDKTLDTDARDYEDACYGCHFDPEIVGREFSLNEKNALLLDNVRDNYFSHRFDVIPSASIKLIDTFDDRLPIVSDGKETETINDYGIEEGRIWCGSCHNVHRQNQFSAEIPEDYKERRSAYLREENYGSSLCYRCHTTYHEDLGGMNHPQDEPLKDKKGVPLLYYKGYSGGIGGFTNGETRFDRKDGEVVCQTCHSVHTAMTDWDGGSNEDDSLEHGRLLVKALDEGFCRDCHYEVHGGASGDCLRCHSPHHGIHLYIATKTPFISSPNVPYINDDPNDPDFIPSSLCYGCHQPHYLFGDDDDNLQKFGVAPIYGDIVLEEENTEKKRNHHPMGTEAILSDSTFLRAPGTEATKHLNKNDEITCISCHAGLHGVIGGKDYSQSKENNFLRWDFTNDNAEFCIKCHSDKAMGGNKIEYDGKHFWNTNSPITRKVFNVNAPGQDYEQSVSCRQCMFCHFIHDGEERDNEIVSGSIRADIDTLMRIGPVNLAWGDRPDDMDINDYEDMCFGCHGEKSIVGESNSGQDALLRPDSFFTHRFASQPDPNSPTISKIIPGGLSEGLFPLADGPDPATETFDDYGTQAGDIYCGTCHDVHAQYNSESPYLNSGESPYKADGFCEACHDDQEGNFVRMSHPIGKGPNSDPAQGRPTEEVFDPNFTKWETSSPGSGQPGGVVTDDGGVICLTCHNTHAAVTSHEGTTKSDSSKDVHGKLLIMDNFPENSTTGDDLCRACHASETFSDDSGVNGAHKDDLGEKDERGICHNCHLPHKAKSENKIWAINLKREFDGVHDLCYSCHNPEDTSTQSGEDNVFLKGRYENHVMFGGAVLEAGDCPDAPSLFKYPEQLTWPREFDIATFPLDPNDRDNVPEKDDGSYCGRSAFSYSQGGEGFYCGTCHNPHKDLSENSNENGDYLRSKPEEQTLMGPISIGTTGKRKPFCIQCHGLVHDAITSDCLLCHHPHKGTTHIEEDEKMGRLIISELSMFPQDFIAIPNVPGITDDSENDKYTSRFCYQCHNEKAQEATGISAIFGDDAGDLKKEHHPMGTEARLSGDTFRRAKGPEATKHLNENEELTCTSCHDDFHGWGPFAGSGDSEKIKANSFLRWVLNDGSEKDKIDFCINCHEDKTNLDGKHMVQADDPNSPDARRGGCMFCHFIHDGDERQNTDDIGIDGVRIRPDVDSLMRYPALNLSWGDKTGDPDDYDYEDLCYGCHGKVSIVGGGCDSGSLLKWSDDNHTHRFASEPDPNSPPSKVIKNGGAFPLSDGTDNITKNDYGTQKGSIFCGTCHNVHDSRVIPYLNHEPLDLYLSPYEPYSFCEECHDAESNNFKFVHNSHPIDKGPNYSVTAESWPVLYSSGESGCKGGATQDRSPSGKIICLTCHNVHAAGTNWKGGISTDPNSSNHGKLLVKDNLSIEGGSTICKECHPFGI